MSLFLLSIALISVLAWVYTMRFPIETYSRELVNSVRVTLIGDVVALTILVVWLFVGKDIISKLNSSKLQKGALFVTLILGLIWISVATVQADTDQGVIFRFVKQFDGGEITDEYLYDYIQRYPFQSGFIIYHWAIAKLFGYGNFLPIRLLNLSYILAAQLFLWKFTRIVFKGKQILNATIILTVVFVPLVLYSTYLYGTIPALAASVIGAYYQALSVKTVRIRKSVIYGVCSAALFGFAVFLKPNSLIFVIASILIWILCAIQNKNGIYLISVMCLIVCSLAGSLIPSKVVESRVGIDLGTGLPKTAWVAMGLQRNSVFRPGTSSGAYPGWFNRYVEDLADYSGYDFEKANEMAKSDIKVGLRELIHDPKGAINFFSEKTVSQWAEPSFGSLWVAFKGRSLQGDNLAENSVLQRSIYQGKLHRAYILFCDIAQTMIYTFAFIGVWKHRKRFTPISLIFGLTFVGGFAYQLVAEANPRYTFVYVFVILPYAALGFVNFPTVKKKFKKGLNNQHKLRKNGQDTVATGKIQGGPVV